MQALNWVDHTALAVLLVFFVVGLFKGLIWQVSRIGILIAAYLLAGHFGADFAAFLARTPAAGTPVPGAAGEPAPGPTDTTLYLAYVLLFLAVLIVLSLAALVLQKLAAKAGLSFFDRLGGGLLGVATGACVVLFGLSLVHMFFRGSQLAQAAASSHSLRLSKRAIDWLGLQVPDDLRRVFDLAPLQSGDPRGRGPLHGNVHGNLDGGLQGDPAHPVANGSPPAPEPRQPVSAPPR